MARSLFSLAPPSELLKLLLSFDLGSAVGAGTASFPALPGRGVEDPEGTWSASMPSSVCTPFVMRTSSPCGSRCTTLVGGRVSGVGASSAARFLELMRGDGAGRAGDTAACFTVFSSSPRTRRGPLLLERRVAMAVSWGLRSVSLGVATGKLSRDCTRRSVDDRIGGRARLAMVLLGKALVSQDHLSITATHSCRGGCRPGSKQNVAALGCSSSVCRLWQLQPCMLDLFAFTHATVRSI
jgi:hypothetical protein